MNENYNDLYINDFKSYKYQIQRIDSFRYFLLYHYGGCYMDLDIGCTDILINNKQSLSIIFTNNYTNNNDFTLLPLTTPVGISNDFICILFNQRLNKKIIVS